MQGFFLFETVEFGYCDMSDSKPEFPIKITFEDGEVEYYQDVENIELNLEDFDIESALDCRVEDALSRNVSLRVSLLNLKRLELG